MRLFQRWFGLSLRVSRKHYLLSGLALMGLKLVVDNSIAYAATGKVWPLIAYILPVWQFKAKALGPMPEWMLVAMALAALPFLWVGISMSVRRAADAGLSPFIGFAFVVPIFNYALMLMLAALPTKADAPAWGAPIDRPMPASVRALDSGAKATLFGLLAAVLVGLAMVSVSIFSMAVYGAAMFFGTPLVMGATTGFFYNLHQEQKLGRTIVLSFVPVMVAGGAILLFAMEGLFCLMMAAPLAAVPAAFGAIVGRAIARQRAVGMARGTSMMLMIGMLPVTAALEARIAEPTLREVTTSVEIDAPPEKVWPNVIGFTELPPPPELYFRLGIAYPMRARIEGSGVGAVRHCEFSTGPFVEPITRWEPPSAPGRAGRLAFDVTAQPPSMSELSPYKNIKAAHLEGYMVSRRGEFRLVPLADGRTRLEGSTWYTLSIFPEAYWTVWGEGLLHAIHGRVLAHIKNLSEQ